MNNKPTEQVEYSEYLSEKYLPFRDQYLFSFYYPKLIKQFSPNTTIIDLGSGLGSFLRFCKKHKISAKGYDTNADMVAQCQKAELDAKVASVLGFPEASVKSAFCDNVLEHLTLEEIYTFFQNLKTKMISGGRLVMLVPGPVGFRKDHTHATFVDVALIESICKTMSLKLTKAFYHPFNCKFISRFLYLNMTVCVIDF
ncbi:MAG: class I SAM-dependent methyltransferase [Bacteroidales bacterium]|nr:class I SAM-dependent methyltransferase [Bacteroidales bacterium]